MEPVLQMEERRSEWLQFFIEEQGQQMEQAERVQMMRTSPIMQPEQILLESQHRNAEPGMRRKAESPKKMIRRRQNFPGDCGAQLRLRGKQAQYKYVQVAEVERAVVQQIADAKLMSKFLRADFSAKVLGVGYVKANVELCLRNIYLMKCVRDRIKEYTGKTIAKVKQKLEAVREYPNVVERAMWEDGKAIDMNTFQIVAVDKNTDASKRRQAYLEKSALQFYLDLRRYKSRKKNGGQVPEAYREDPMKTSVEASLSVLEARYQIPRQDPIMKSFTRSTSKLGIARVGDVIRASDEEVQGKREDLAVKRRFAAIYGSLKERLIRNNDGENISTFLTLQPWVSAYVYGTYSAGINIRDAEKIETILFSYLKDGLDAIRRNGTNKCSKYAAILLGFLAKESNGYLEVPPIGIQVSVDDRNIGLEDWIHFGKDATRDYRDCRNVPLFAHRPNISDIVQGNLGDCYLLAGLISVVDLNPEKIMNIMRDNGDGTVTVCFQRGEYQGGRGVYTPFYVTVKKTIPVNKENETDAFSKGAFWVKMMEKAYAASGLHLGAWAWGNFRKYQEIASGRPDAFISLLLGKDCEIHVFGQGGIAFAERSVDSGGFEYAGMRSRQTVRRTETHKKAASDGKHLWCQEGIERRKQQRNRYYTRAETKLYEMIDTYLNAGYYVTFGTKDFGGPGTGKNGETMSGGLVGRHAYTILNTYMKWTRDRVYLFLVVKNPWGYQGVEYTVGRAGLSEKSALLTEQKGVFLLDLKKFARVVDMWFAVSNPISN